MAKPPKRGPERKLQTELSVSRGVASAAEAAHRAGVAEQTEHDWKNAFSEAGRAGRAGPAAAVIAGGRERRTQVRARRGESAVACPGEGSGASPSWGTSR